MAEPTLFSRTSIVKSSGRSSTRADAAIASMSDADKQRFWSKVSKAEPNRCWPWNCGKFRNGYGMMSIGRSTHRASRVAWVLGHGTLPGELYVCHKCDNKACCNPAHLFLGTANENYLDCLAKKRVSRGEKHSVTCRPKYGSDNHQSKLSDAKVRMIRKIYRKGISQEAIAERFGVSQSLVSVVVLRQGWKHVA